MTTERHESRVRTSPLELRLYVAALLAVVYTITWRVIGGTQTTVAPTIAPVFATTTLEPPRVVWIDTLPPELRPAVTLPDGWQRAADARSPAAPPERVVRIPNRRVPRVRTRSS